MVAVDNRQVGQGAPTTTRLRRSGSIAATSRIGGGKDEGGHLSEVTSPSDVL